jgi:hypothetical protein
LPQNLLQESLQNTAVFSMKHVQHVRGKWIARVTVPEELREIIGKRELVEELPSEKSGRDRRALAVLNGWRGFRGRQMR